MSTKVVGKSEISLIGQKARDYVMLVKLRLSLTVVFSSVMAYLIASELMFNWVAVAVLALGGFLVTGAANILNQVMEKDFDRLMSRTADRPLAAGRMEISEAVMAAGLMSMFGITLLALFNPWTAFFGTLALLSYAFLYTPLKRLTPAAVFVGAIPGALPMLIGCVAAQGELSLLALSLFGIQFFWQFPHFWAIGWLGFEDYSKAGYKLVPSKNGKPDGNIAVQSFIYTLFLLPVSLLPFYLGTTGWISGIIVGVMGLGYTYFAFNFYRVQDRNTALRLMFYSFCYIPVSLIVLFADKI